MNISEAISELRWKVTRARNEQIALLKAWRLSHPAPTSEEDKKVIDGPYGVLSSNINNWEKQIKALEAPLIGIVVDQNNRVLVATQWCVFELKGDKLVLLTFERIME